MSAENPYAAPAPGDVRKDDLIEYELGRKGDVMLIDGDNTRDTLEDTSDLPIPESSGMPVDAGLVARIQLGGQTSMELGVFRDRAQVFGHPDQRDPNKPVTHIAIIRNNPQHGIREVIGGLSPDSEGNISVGRKLLQISGGNAYPDDMAVVSREHLGIHIDHESGAVIVENTSANGTTVAKKGGGEVVHTVSE